MRNDSLFASRARAASSFFAPGESIIVKMKTIRRNRHKTLVFGDDEIRGLQLRQESPQTEAEDFVRGGAVGFSKKWLGGAGILLQFGESGGPHLVIGVSQLRDQSPLRIGGKRFVGIQESLLEEIEGFLLLGGFKARRAISPRRASIEPRSFHRSG